MKPVKILLIFVFALNLGMSYGQISDFKYKLDLQHITNSWHKIKLPDQIFEHANDDLSDIRILGINKMGDTIEIPYLIDISGLKVPKKELNFKLINQSSNQNSHFFTLDTDRENIINEILLEFEQDNFDWKLHLEGSNNQKEWFSITSEYRILSIKNELTDYHFSKIVFPDSKFRYYRFMIKSTEKPMLNKAFIYEKSTTDGLLKNLNIKDIRYSTDKKLKRTVVEIELPMRVPVSEITVKVKDSVDYYRNLKILYLTDSVQLQSGWKFNFSEIASGTLNSIENNSFSFSPITSKKIKLIIENYDNAPLNFDSINLKGPEYSLIARFEDTGIPYEIYYGNNKIGKPYYDLAYFKSPPTVSEIQTGKEVAILHKTEAIKGALFQNKWWLWLTMGIIMVTLGWFSYIMIKKNNAN